MELATPWRTKLSMKMPPSMSIVMTFVVNVEIESVDT